MYLKTSFRKEDKYSYKLVYNDNMKSDQQHTDRSRTKNSVLYKYLDIEEWLVMNSIKTGVKLNIPLYLLFNGKALGIMRKYDSIEQLAALGCNSDTNRTLQKLGRMAHIGKKFTYHTSRHTCATLLVHQGVPITTVQKLLGHTSVKTTEIYSEVFDETIIKDLTRANQKYYNRRNVKQNQIKSQKYPEKYLRQ